MRKDDGVKVPIFEASSTGMALLAVVLVGLSACTNREETFRHEREDGPVRPDSHASQYAPAKQEEEQVICKARGSGRWFPADGKELKRMITEYVSSANVPAVKGQIFAAIAPHAGYIYSGKVAGYTFRAIQDNAAAGHKPEVVIILGFNHRRGFPGVALMEGDAMDTPLGRVLLDRETGGLLVAQSERIVFNTAAHGDEHSAENEVPFVQAVLPGVKIVIGLIGDHDNRTLEALVKALAQVAKEKKILVIASADMLHDADYEKVTITDKATLKRVEAMDVVGLAESWDMRKQVFCGIGPVLAVMRYAQQRGCKAGTVVHYRNSGDDFPDSRGNWVVGYGAVVFSSP